MPVPKIVESVSYGYGDRHTHAGLQHFAILQLETRGGEKIDLELSSSMLHSLLSDGAAIFASIEELRASGRRRESRARSGFRYEVERGDAES